LAQFPWVPVAVAVKLGQLAGVTAKKSEGYTQFRNALLNFMVLNADFVLRGL
jgi:hypothetical protein